MRLVSHEVTDSKSLPQNSPLVSVVMPVYNAENYLGQAIESILGQTFQDFEMICVDDKSTDGSLELLHSYAQRDSRIRVLQNERNLGESASRNAGMAVASGEYIAGQDADDVSLPVRLERQVAYLQTTPDVGVLGAAMLLVNEYGAALRQWPVFETDVVLRCLLLVTSPIPHPSVIFRRHIIQEIRGYREDLVVAADYELWVRAASICKIANLPDVLVHYRQTPGQLSSKQSISRRSKLEINLIALNMLAEERNLGISDVQVMSDLANGYWQELNPQDVVRAGEMIWSIMHRCLVQWGGSAEEEHTIRQWLFVQMMRVAGSMLRAGRRDAGRVCLPAALQIAPANRGGLEDVWLRLQGVVGPRIARHLTQFVKTARRPLVGRSKRAVGERSWLR